MRAGIVAQCDKLFIAAALAFPVGEPFNAADLAVAAFACYPEDFSLPGYPGAPDSRAVAVRLYAGTSPVLRGFLVKLGKEPSSARGQGERWAVTPSGVAAMQGLCTEEFRRGAVVAIERERGRLRDAHRR